jgi:DNA-binding GntR family transcriptional regulator
MEKAPARTSLTEFAVEQIRNAILSGELPPESFTTAEKLAKSIGMSRTPVREALLRLEQAGMVCIERTQGVRVLPVTVQDLEDAFQLRLMLEVPATYRAAQLIDEGSLDQLQGELDEMTAAARDADYSTFMEHDARFHELIHLASGNQMLARIVRHVRQTITDRGLLTREHLPDLNDLIGEHKMIREALTPGNPYGAAEAMYDHLSGVRTKVLKERGTSGRVWFNPLFGLPGPASDYPLRASADKVG